jgi:predicted ATPase/DNA-binding SARP family transcriptional activator
MPHLSIDAVGPLRIKVDGEVITGQAYNKVWALLVYLAIEADRHHPREALAGLLWPDQPEERARTNLRQALTRLRHAIGDRSATPPLLSIQRRTIQFNLESDYRLDVAAFLDLLSACDNHSHRHTETCTVCAQRREEAVGLYRGPFLDNFYIGDSDLFEEWAIRMREHLHQRALGALTDLAAYHERRGNYPQALEYSERVLNLDPWREEAYRQVMRMLALTGQRSAALNQYERCRAILDAELGVAPSAETTALYQSIQSAEFQPAESTDFRSLPAARPHSLPLQPTPFIGREQELTALADLLADPQCRLITLVGPGGSGKTRLAIQAAGNESEAFADGVVYVALAPLTAAEFIIPAVAAALQVTLDGHPAPRKQLLHYLSQKEVLLVLDNFEHLLAPPAPHQGHREDGLATDLLASILQHAPGVTMLVTSRARLNLQGEWVYDVGGLETPGHEVSVSNLLHEMAGEEERAAFEAYSAVTLFLQTARRVQADFDPTADDRAAILRICQLVQGMPLALELAAAWVRVLSCSEIVHEIDASLAFLTTTLRDLPERHRSIEAVFDHSWKLLSPDEQQVFARCSVFRGGFTREAAAEVAGASLPILAALADKSMLRRHLNGRYEVHELARQYAAERLAASGHSAQVRNLHLTFFMNFAERAEPHLHRGQQVAQWHDWLEFEHDNLRAALGWSLGDGDFEPGLRMVGALWEFWMGRGHAREGEAQAERFLAKAESTTQAYTYTKALHTAGVLAFYQGHYQPALSRLAEVAALSRQLGADGKYLLALALIGQSYALLHLWNFDNVEALCRESLGLGCELEDFWLQGHAHNQLGHLNWYRDDETSARRHFLESFACFEAGGRGVMRGTPLMRVGIILYEQGDYAASRAYLTQSLAIFEEVDDKLRMSTTYRELGNLAMVQGNNREAQGHFTRALTLIERSGHLPPCWEILHAMGQLAQRQSDTAQARALYGENLTLALEVEDRVRIARSLEAFACLAAEQGEAERAVRLSGAAATLAPAEPLRRFALRSEHDRWLAAARKQLGGAGFAAAWSAGAAMTLDEVVALAKARRQEM